MALVKKAKKENPLPQETGRFVMESVIADVSGRAVQSLRADRCLRRGLPYYRVGKSGIRYDLQECLDIIRSTRIDPEAD